MTVGESSRRNICNFLKKKKKNRKLSHGLIKEGCVLCGEREKNPEREREREGERERDGEI